MIDYEKLKHNLNELQIETIRDIKAIAFAAHKMDLTMRLGSNDLHFQADWLKHVLEQINLDKIK